MSRPRDAEFTSATKVKALLRSGGKCEECGRRLGTGGEPAEFNHRKPVWEGGDNSLDNCQPLCAFPCHARITGQQAGERSEARRHQKKAAGIKRQPKRGFRGWRNFRNEIVWRE